jgi:hypothetical protein
MARRRLEIVGRDLPPPPTLDGFVLMFLFYAMQRADVLRVKGTVSADAMRNFQAFQEAWRCLCPDKYRVARIEPDNILTSGSPGGNIAAISGFSGGIDASFLALRHGKRLLGDASYPLAEAVIVHGFDVPYADQATFDRLLSRAAPILEECGLAHTVVRTNVRRFRLSSWQHTFGTHLAAVLHQFSSGRGFGLIGSSEPYNHPLYPWGSTPATDHLLSGDAMRIVHEGAGFSRTEKVELIAQHPSVAKHVKVCWEGPDPSRNCGSCEKCVRTRLNFMAVGADDPGCFDTPFDVGAIDNLMPVNGMQLTELVTILEYAERHGREAEWTDRLRNRLTYLRADSARFRANPARKPHRSIATRLASSVRKRLAGTLHRWPRDIKVGPFNEA